MPGYFARREPVAEGSGHAGFVEQGVAYCDEIEATYRNPMTNLRSKLNEFRDLACGETVDVVRLRAFCEQIADANVYLGCAFDELRLYANDFLKALTGLSFERRWTPSGTPPKGQKA